MSTVELLQDLVRIDTTNPPGNEIDAAEILHSRLTAGGLKSEILTSPGGRASVVGRFPGPPTERALVLLSHLDVVGVEEEQWSHDPFGAEIEDGFVWGRGTLDMKGIAAMHAMAAMDLASTSTEVSREVIVVSVADEEAGGNEGARWLVEEHADAVGFADSRPAPEVIGEGAFGLSGLIERPLMPIALGEKSALWLNLDSTGDPGHGAMPPKSQASMNLSDAVRAVSGFHQPRVHPIVREQFNVLKGVAPRALATALALLGSPAGSRTVKAARPALASLGRIGTLLADTVVVTRLEAGYKHNVVPGHARAALDCRLLPDTDIDDFVSYIERKVRRHSVGVSEVSRHGGPVSNKGPTYGIIEAASADLPGRPVVVPSLTPGITDIRHFRRRGATGYGWVPLVLSPELLATIHGHDERVEVNALEKAADAMSSVVRRAATSGSEVGG